MLSDSPDDTVSYTDVDIAAVNTSDATTASRFTPTAQRLRRITRWGAILAEFCAVQVAVRGVGVIAGILIVRTLSKPEFALYAIANSSITMFNLLADLGIAPALRAIGGEVHRDHAEFSSVVATAGQLRRYLAAFAFAISVPLTAWMLHSNGASPLTTAVLSAMVVVASWPLLTGTVLRETALMLGKYRKVQFVDGACSIARLLVIVAAFARLSALLGMVSAAVGNWAQWFAYRRSAANDIDVHAAPTPGYRARVLAMVKRLMPNTLFFCFQGQITFLLLTLFGTTTGLASVAALGRIAAIISVFGTVFNNVLAPRFACCQNPAQLPRLYFALTTCSVLLLAPFAALAWFLPEPFLWIIGDAYRGLEFECFLVVLTAVVGQLASVMVWLNHSRGWVHWYAFANIPAILAVQALAIPLLDLATVRGVLVFSLLTAVAPMPVYALDTWRGLKLAAEKPAATITP